MAIFPAYIRSLGNTNTSKTTTERIFVTTLAITLVTCAVLPSPALAFETELNDPVFEASVQILYKEDFQPNAQIIHELSYTNRLASSAKSGNTPDTKISEWPPEHSQPLETISQTPIHSITPRLTPVIDNPIVLQGEASFYSRAGCLGCSPNRTMANGQPLNDNALTMAIGANMKHLVGYRAKVTNLSTNMSVDVLITDTGGFYQEKYGNRVADLTIASKTAIGMYGGVGHVKVEIY